MISSIVEATPTSQQQQRSNLNEQSKTSAVNKLLTTLAPVTNNEFEPISTMKSRNYTTERYSTDNTPVSDAIDSTTSSKLSISREEESSTGGIAEFIDNNYLSAGLENQDSSPAPELAVTKVEDASLSEIDYLLASKANSLGTKSKRQAYHMAEAADWWTKLSSKRSNTGKAAQPVPADTKSSSSGAEKRRTVSKGVIQSTKKTDPHNDPSASGKRTVYKEQPLSQNAILTIRNQLAAIRGKHRVLVTKSIRQLQQLDTKLIDSYKLCLKKKMPLYAGMLYRTRDFVVKMAKEVKHERKVLEAMTKQVQNVLRQKMTNRTLVKEYNRLVYALNDPTRATNESQKITTIRVGSSKTTFPRVKQEGSPPTEDGLQQPENAVTEQQTEQTNVPYINSPATIGRKNSYGSKSKTSGQHFKSSFNSTTDFSSNNKSKQQTRDKQETKKSKPSIRYTVSVDEVNLKKELNKIQALIDRINGSSYELNSVADDIVRLFKLNNSDFTYKKGSSLTGKMSKLDKMYYSQTLDEISGTAEQRRMRKMFRSPARVFLEKYGKLSMNNSGSVIPNNDSTNVTNTSGTIYNQSTTSLPEMKPLFDAASLVYTESTDQDLGFDVPSNGE